jgi:ribosomal protein L28
MPKPLERRRKPRRKAIHVTGPTWVMLENVPGARADIRAKVVDFNEAGIRIHVSLLLHVNHVLLVKTQAAGVVPNGRATARVVDCRALTGSGYTVGLTFERSSNQTERREAPAMERYEILTLKENRNVHLRILDRSEAATKESEKLKRREILELLYTARRSHPGQATVSLHELEELLNCHREQLDFSLWYLDQSAFIDVSENGHYSITVNGVDYLEAEEAAQSKNQRLLAAGE